MSIKIARRMEAIQPSLTLAITAKAKQLKAEGKDIISFGAGEPDFDTPQHIKEGAISAMKAGQTKYTPVGGSPAMKEAIISKFKRDNGLDFTVKEVMASNGGKHILYNLFMATLNSGDEVIIPTPYWVSYPDQVKLAEGKPVYLDCDVKEEYLLKPEKLEKMITPKTKMLILNSPSNPTGVCYSKEELEALLEVLEKYPDIIIVSDDIYEHILYDGLAFWNVLMLKPEWKERCFLVNGVSKAYSMTGWRIGYCAGPASIISVMEKIQGQATSNPSSISQAAAIAALEGKQDCVKEILDAFSKRRDIVYNALQKLSFVSTILPKGAFYIFPDISAVYQTKKFQDLASKNKDIALSQLFCSYLLEHYNVAAVPGVAFGNDNAIRISYAVSKEQLKEGLVRIEKMLGSFA